MTGNFQIYLICTNFIYEIKLRSDLFAVFKLTKLTYLKIKSSGKLNFEYQLHLSKSFCI